MPEDQKLTALVKLLEAKLADKKNEMDALSQPILDRTPEYNHRKFQVEVEYWYGQGLLTDIRSLVESFVTEQSATS